ncbi:hypothetical protein PsYK624_113510 [Phanerochaete sordida]|uniref:Uncharacterized protein n=1 Tax=Phanerochaete sordida TaxID=48140 RepID=A0A9P3LHC3_9APHY|nr:hypothetical protein PsYK624_113510 [Phanerochaete sordida]
MRRPRGLLDGGGSVGQDLGVDAQLDNGMRRADLGAVKEGSYTRTPAQPAFGRASLNPKCRRGYSC